MKQRMYILKLMLILSSAGVAQTSNLSVLDFYVLQKPLITSIDSLNNDTSIVKLEAMFKCSDFSQADSVFFLFGSTAGGTDIMTAGVSIIQNNTSYKLLYNGDEFPVIGNWDARMYFSMAKQTYMSVNYVGIRVKDKSGAITILKNYQVIH